MEKKNIRKIIQKNRKVHGGDLDRQNRNMLSKEWIESQENYIKCLEFISL